MSSNITINVPPSALSSNQLGLSRDMLANCTHTCGNTADPSVAAMEGGKTDCGDAAGAPKRPRAPSSELWPDYSAAVRSAVQLAKSGGVLAAGEVLATMEALEHSHEAATSEAKKRHAQRARDAQRARGSSGGGGKGGKKGGGATLRKHALNLDAELADGFVDVVAEPVLVLLEVLRIIGTRAKPTPICYVMMRALGSVLRLRTRMPQLRNPPGQRHDTSEDTEASDNVGARVKDKRIARGTAPPAWHFEPAELAAARALLPKLPTRMWATALKSLRLPPEVVEELVVAPVLAMVEAGDVLTAAPIIATTHLHGRFDVAKVLTGLTECGAFDVASKLARSAPNAKTTTIPTLIHLLEACRQVRMPACVCCVSVWPALDREPTHRTSWP